MYKVRKATLDDFSSLQNLSNGLFMFEKRFTHTYNENWPYESSGKEFFVKQIVSEDAVTLLAEIDGKAVGYITGRVELIRYRKPNLIGFLYNLFIDEDHRQKGVGKMIIEEFKKQMKEKGADILKVDALFENENAVEFYKSFGFEPHILNLEMPL